MKVLMFGWEFPPYISGGLGTACYGLTSALSHLGIDIRFVLPTAGSITKKTHVELIDAGKFGLTGEERENVEMHYSESAPASRSLEIVPVNTILTPYLSEEEYLSAYQAVQIKTTQDAVIAPLAGGYGSSLFSEIHRFAVIGGRIAAEGGFDIIHAHDWMTCLAGIEAKKVSGKPLILHVHATEIDRSGDNINQTIFNIEQDGMNAADKVIAVSHFTRDILINRYGIAPEKVCVVHNAVMRHDGAGEGYGKVFRDRVVLFLGRITMQKGPEYFVQAARQVVDRLRNVRFVMAGTGDLLPKLIRYAAELRLQSHFHFTGFLSGSDLERMFAMSDLLVMPSVSEPFGLVPVEAISRGLPVIISKQSGVSEVLPHVEKVDYWDVNKLADTIIGILINDKRRREQIERHHDALIRIDWKHAAELVSGLYDDLTAK